MSITDLTSFIKSASPSRKRDVLTVSVIILGALGGFALGRLSANSDTPITIKQPAALGESFESRETVSSQSVEGSFEAPGGTGSVVASKTGSKYFFPWCGGARTIKEGNKIWFDSVEQARSAGYLPALNCKGLE